MTSIIHRSTHLPKTLKFREQKKKYERPFPKIIQKFFFAFIT